MTSMPVDSANVKSSYIADDLVVIQGNPHELDGFDIFISHLKYHVI